MLTNQSLLRKNKLDRIYTIKKTILPSGQDVSLVKYLTKDPKKMSIETKNRWLPGFDGSYEIIIGLDKRYYRSYAHNTPPKLSWYVDLPTFRKLHSIIKSANDFHVLNRLLGNYVAHGMNHLDVKRQVNGLLGLLGPKRF